MHQDIRYDYTLQQHRKSEQSFLDAKFYQSGIVILEGAGKATALVESLRIVLESIQIIITKSYFTVQSELAWVYTAEKGI